MAPFRTTFFIPLGIILIGVIPLLTFGRFFSWTVIVPFVLVLAFASLMPAAMFGGFPLFRRKTPGSEDLMEAIGEWLRTHRSS